MIEKIITNFFTIISFVVFGVIVGFLFSSITATYHCSSQTTSHIKCLEMNLGKDKCNDIFLEKK